MVACAAATDCRSPPSRRRVERHHGRPAEGTALNEPAYIAALLLLGAATGFAAGLLGIGGGMLMVPFLTLLFTWRGYPTEHIVHMAIATSLATIMFTSVSSMRAHHQRGAVLWPVVRCWRQASCWDR